MFITHVSEAKPAAIIGKTTNKNAVADPIGPNSFNFTKKHPHWTSEPPPPQQKILDPPLKTFFITYLHTIYTLKITPSSQFQRVAA